MLVATLPAAQYVRMSTEHQQYSLVNQSAAIAAYAEQHGFIVTKTYADPARSGLTLKARTGLRELLNDVVSGTQNFKAILVYDVSRWGRFQDVDEAAHYEYLCKQAGAPVHYCAEPFPNDSTLPSALLKALKRSMAAEFSRELGVKVYRGKSRLAQMGFRVGGEAGYGLRRVMVSSDGKPKGFLQRGENKCLTTDRTVLVPGPAEETDWVRIMFEMALTRSPQQIARFLNREGVKLNGSPWKYRTVQYLLQNPNYMGCNVWGRTSAKLRSRRKIVPVSEWTTCPHAFEPIISPEVFDRVQAKLKRRDYSRDPHHTDDDLIQHLKATFAKYGRLSTKILRLESPPNPGTMRRRFGNLRRAFNLAGFNVSSNIARRISKCKRHAKIQDDVCRAIVRACPEHLSVVKLFRHRQTIIVDGQSPVLVTPCRVFRTKRGKLRWVVRIPHNADKFISLLCLFRPNSDNFQSFYLMPPIAKKGSYFIRTEADPWLCAGHRLRSFSQFYPLALALF